MKSPAVLLSCFLIVAPAFAEDPLDPFGKPIHPTVPPLPTPTRSATPAPVTPSSAVTILQQALGPLQGNLKAWFSFDTREKGGLAWSSEPIGAMFHPAVALRDTERGKVADFTTAGAVVGFTKAVQLGKRYTLMAWASFPIPKEHAGVLFHGSRGLLLSLKPTGHFVAWTPDKLWRNYDLVASKLTGWHHLALSVDGRQSALYLDGRPNGTIPYVIDEELLAIGNHPLEENRHWMMAEKVDDVLIFNRDLSGAEIGKVMQAKFVAAAVPAAPVPVAPKPPAPAPEKAPAAAPPTSSDPRAAEILRTYRNSLVFVSGAEGNGSGFIANAGGTNFVFTNAHVAAGIKGAGFKTLDGTAVQIGEAGIAVGHDAFRLQVAPGGQPFEIMQGVDEKAAIGDMVVVLGNAEGAGVINLITGRIVGIGPDRVEVDAPFQPGNSGSPIIHLKTKQVIGVATYLTIKKYDAATKEVLKAPVVRRFGFRLDSVKTWQPVNWPAFLAQAAEMEKIETLTGDLENFLVDLSKNEGKVTTGVHNNPAIKTRIDQWLGSKRKGMTDKDLTAANQNFLAFLKVTCRSDVTTAQPHMTYDYFQRQLTEETGYRTEFADIFDKIIKEIGQ